MRATSVNQKLRLKVRVVKSSPATAIRHALGKASDGDSHQCVASAARSPRSSPTVCKSSRPTILKSEFVNCVPLVYGPELLMLQCA
jgi:hypothetical protein